MKYFFLNNSNGETSIIVAETLESAKQYAGADGAKIESLYELKEDTFTQEGFLITQPASAILEGCDQLIVETDEDSPITIAEITAESMTIADGYRARLRPIYD